MHISDVLHSESGDGVAEIGKCFTLYLAVRLMGQLVEQLLAVRVVVATVIVQEAIATSVTGAGGKPCGRVYLVRIRDSRGRVELQSGANLSPPRA